MNNLFKDNFRTILGAFLLGILCLSGLKAGEMIVIPRQSGQLPELKLSTPELSKSPKLVTLPYLTTDKSDTREWKVQSQLKKPRLIDSVGEEDYSPRQASEQRRQSLSPEKFFYLTGRIRGISWVKVYLYEKKGGFFDLYQDENQMNLLGTDQLDSEGNFRIGPLKYDKGWLYEGRDVVLVMELDSPYAVAYSDLYGTIKPFRYKIVRKQRVVPEGGRYEMGTIEVNWAADHYYPVRAYRRILNRLKNEGKLTDQKVRIEFLQEVKEPRYMEEIGYILMPYSAE